MGRRYTECAVLGPKAVEKSLVDKGKQSLLKQSQDEELCRQSKKEGPARRQGRRIPKDVLGILKDFLGIP